MKISIFGLGYVGAVSLACLARDGHQVIGVDIDASKLELIRQGRSPIIEEGIIELFDEVTKSGNVEVTDNAEYAIHNTELSFICVGTPAKPNGDQDLSAMIRLSEQFGDALRSKSEKHTVVIRSTVQPGTTTGTVQPIIEGRANKKAGADFFLGFQPEFLREGTSIRDYDNPPMTVVGATESATSDSVRKLFQNLSCPFFVTDIPTAETLKYACNAFHALKISFANEVGRICQSLDVDSHEVMNLLCEDKQLNVSRAYLRPGFAFGGSCLPKDIQSLLYLAKRGDVEVPVLSSLLPSNRTQVEHALSLILGRGVRSVSVIGLSFKSGTDDLRDSPMVTLVEQLIGKGVKIRIFDPEVRVSQLIGANRRFIDEVIPHIGELMTDSVSEACDGAELVVVGLSGDEIIDDVIRQSTSEQLVLDLVGMGNRDKLNSEYVGVCW